MSEKIMFNIGVEIEGPLSSSKLNQMTETVAAALTAVAVPQQDVKVADPKVTYFKHWHEHKPDENEAPCKTCKQIASINVKGE